MSPLDFDTRASARAPRALEACVGPARRWVRLVFCCAIVAVFVLEGARWLEERTPLRDWLAPARRRSLDTGALFYTELPETAEALDYLRRRRP